MPIEIRRIEFSEIELQRALLLYHARTEGGLEEETNVSAIKVMGGDDFNIVAKVSSARNDVVTRKVFDHASCVAAFVLYAKRARIPLPRNAPKVLSVTKTGCVAMTMKYQHNVPGIGKLYSVPDKKSA